MNNNKWILSFVKRNFTTYLLGFLVMLLQNIFIISNPYIQKEIIDKVLIGKDYSAAPMFFVLLAISLICPTILITVIGMIHHKMGYKLRIELANDIIKHIYKIPISIFQNERVTRYVHILSSDAYEVGEDVAHQIPRFVQTMFMGLMYMVVLAYFDPIIMISVVALSFSYVFVSRYFSKKIKLKYRETKEEKTKLLIHIEEGISSTREVITYNRHGWEMVKYNKLYKKYYRKVIELIKLENRGTISSEPLKWGISLLVLFYGGYQVIGDKMTLGSFLAIYSYSSQMVKTFQRAFWIYTTRLSYTMVNINRVRELVEDEEIEDGNLELNGKIENIKFENCFFRYNDSTQDVLRDLTIDFPIGKKIAFVGESGGGKSTVSKLLIRSFYPKKGQILVNNKNLGDIKIKDWMDKLTIISQEPYLFPDTIRTNITFGLDNISQEKLEEVCDKMCINDFILSLPKGYDTQVGERGITLSGGQRQRVALARALLRNSEILILDESTSSLDLETERLVQNNIDEIRKGKTTLIIAHRLSTIINSDIIYVLDKGEIIEQGTHEELINLNGMYTSYYK